MNNTAIVLASGMGKRMGGDIPKQFALVGGKPLIYYALKAFEESDIIQNVVIATSDYGVTIHAAVEKDNIFACQFHPEKSSDTGLQILKNFISM